MKFEVYDTKYIQIGSDAFRLEPKTEYKLEQFPEHLRKAIEYIITKNPIQFKILPVIPVNVEKITILPKVKTGKPVIEPEPEKDVEIDTTIVEPEKNIEVEEPTIEPEPEISEEKIRIDEIDFDSMTKQQLIDYISDRTDNYTKSQLNKMKVQEVRDIAKSL